MSGSRPRPSASGIRAQGFGSGLLCFVLWVWGLGLSRNPMGEPILSTVFLGFAV